MLEMEGFKQDLAEVRRMLDEAGQSLQIEHLKEQLIEYQEDMGSAGFWDDTERAQKVSAKASSVERQDSALRASWSPARTTSRL